MRGNGGGGRGGEGHKGTMEKIDHVSRLNNISKTTEESGVRRGVCLLDFFHRLSKQRVTCRSVFAHKGEGMREKEGSVEMRGSCEHKRVEKVRGIEDK